MKQALIGIVLGLTLALSGYSFMAYTADWGLIREVTYSIGDENSDICSATKIDPTHLLTAAHCVNLDETVVVRNGDDVVGHAKTVKRTAMADLALLEILDGVEGAYAPVALLEAIQDEEVVLAGYPLDVGEILTTGFVQGPRYRSFTNGEETIVSKFTLVTSPGTYGNSGGGLFVYRFYTGWQLVGVCSAMAMQPVYTDFGYGSAPYNNTIYTVSQTEIVKFLAQ